MRKSTPFNAICKRLTRIHTNIYYIWRLWMNTFITVWLPAQLNYIYVCIYIYIYYVYTCIYIYTSIPMYMSNSMDICIHPSFYRQGCMYLYVCPTLPNQMQLLISIDCTHPPLALLEPCPLSCDGRSAYEVILNRYVHEYIPIYFWF